MKGQGMWLKNKKNLSSLLKVLMDSALRTSLCLAIRSVALRHAIPLTDDRTHDLTLFCHNRRIATTTVGVVAYGIDQQS